MKSTFKQNIQNLTDPQSKRFKPSRGMIIGLSPSKNRADVQVNGNQGLLKGVPVGLSLKSYIAVGQTCLVIYTEEGNAQSSIVAQIFPPTI